MENKSKNINFRNNKKLHVFFIFLILSIFFWTLSKLSKEYTHPINFKVKYANSAKDKLLQNTPKENIIIVLKTSGFKLFGYNLNNPKLEVNLRDIKQKDNRFYYLPNNHIAELQAQLSSEETIIKINSDTIFFDFGKLKNKQINVNPVLKLNYESGFNLIEQIHISPKTISITGPEKQIDSISSINTKLLELTNISTNFKKSISLDIPKKLNKIHFSETTITIKGNVEKFTEGNLTLNFELKNVPKNFKITTFSKKVNLTYKVSLKNFNKIKPSDFKVICDLKNRQNDSLNYLLPTLVKQSNLVSDIKISPKVIEFLITKSNRIFN